MLTSAFVLICLSVLVYLSEHWVTVSVRDRDAVTRQRLNNLLAWRTCSARLATPTKPRRIRQPNAFDMFLRDACTRADEPFSLNRQEEQICDQQP
jgi:hypothetical protein